MTGACFTHNYNDYSADIIFEVKDKPHPLFKRKGTDLIFNSSISLLMVIVLTFILCTVLELVIVGSHWWGS